MKELVAGLALVGLASASKTRGGGGLSGSPSFHFGKSADLVADGYEILKTKAYSCEETVRKALKAYGMAAKAEAHLDSISQTYAGAGQTEWDDEFDQYVEAVESLKRDSEYYLEEKSCLGDSSRLRQQQTGRYYR